MRTECEFLRRKIDLMEKEFESRKHEFEETIKELETRNMEVCIELIYIFLKKRAFAHNPFQYYEGG